ncbi:MAG: hypothetical protein ACJA01_002053 [Saprospiraceae bacterium]|jgi:hypothetical protein
MYKYSLIYRILSFSLACLMLLTSFDYSVNLHYCQDNFVGISFNDDAKGCSGKTSSCASMKKMASEEEDPNCCKNKKVHIDDLDEDFTSPMMAELFDQTFDLNAIIDLPVLSYTNYGKQVISYTSYRPPPPDIDFQVQYQVFII